jgi:hypothetical protein
MESASESQPGALRIAESSSDESSTIKFIKPKQEDPLIAPVGKDLAISTQSITLPNQVEDPLSPQNSSPSGSQTSLSSQTSPVLLTSASSTLTTNGSTLSPRIQNFKRRYSNSRSGSPHENVLTANRSQSPLNIRPKNSSTQPVANANSQGTDSTSPQLALTITPPSHRRLQTLPKLLEAPDAPSASPHEFIKQVMNDAANFYKNRENIKKEMLDLIGNVKYTPKELDEIVEKAIIDKTAESYRNKCKDYYRYTLKRNVHENSLRAHAQEVATLYINQFKAIEEHKKKQKCCVIL